MTTSQTKAATWRDTPARTLRAGGVTFAYRQLGEDTEVPLIVLPHFAAVLDDWDPWTIDGIATRRRVIAFDNRGIGASTGSAPHSVDEMAQDAVTFIDALDYKHVELLGCSLGGFVAQTIAIQQPALVRRLVLAGTGPAGGGDGTARLAAATIGALTRGALTRRHPKHYLFFPYQMRAPHELSAILQPTLVANDDDDVMLPTKYSMRMAEHLPNARLRIYPASGHGGVFQHHAQFVADVLELLEA